MVVMVFARWIINLTSSPVAPCSCVTLPSSPGSMLAMETLARLVMLDREKEEEIGMLKHGHVSNLNSNLM